MGEKEKKIERLLDVEVVGLGNRNENTSGMKPKVLLRETDTDLVVLGRK